MTRAAAPVVALAAVLALAGCGEKRHGSSGSSGASSASISETEFKLSPAAASVAMGGTITVKNDGKVTHALEIELPNGEIKTKPISPGQTVDVKAPDKAGSYDMYCPIDHHKQRGMTGKITVGGSSKNSSGGGGSSPGGY